MHFDEIWTWFPILMWFCIEELLKLTNLSKRSKQPNSCTCDENSTKNWKKINLTSYESILILYHEETSPIRFWYVFHEIRLKISFYNLWWKGLSYGVRWKNVLCFENCVGSLCFHTWKSFLTSKTSMRWKNMKTRTKSSLL